MWRRLLPPSMDPWNGMEWMVVPGWGQTHRPWRVIPPDIPGGAPVRAPSHSPPNLRSFVPSRSEHLFRCRGGHPSDRVGGSGTRYIPFRRLGVDVPASSCGWSLSIGMGISNRLSFGHLWIPPTTSLSGSTGWTLVPSPPLPPSLSSPVSKEDSHPSFSNPPPFRTVHDPPCKSFLNTPLSRSGRVRKGRRKQVQGDVQVSSATSTRLTANQTTRPCVEAVHGTRTNDTPKKREPEGKVDEKDSMKFGKLLRNTAEAQPEWADAYLDYKLLKKKLKALKRKDEDTGERRRKKKKKHARKRRTKTCVSRRSTDHARRTDVTCGKRTPKDARATNGVETDA